MPGPPPDVTTKRWFSDGSAVLHVGQQPGELARVLVVARPLDRLPRLGQLGLVLLVGVADAARLERRQRALGALAAVDAGRSEEHDGVLNLLVLEAPQRLEILRQDADRPAFGALEKLRDTDTPAAAASCVCHFTISGYHSRSTDGASETRAAEPALEHHDRDRAPRRRSCSRRSSTPARSARGGRSARSVTTPRALGPYAIEWRPTDFRDEILGRLGGVFRGTVMQFEPGAGILRRRRVSGCRPTAIRSDRWRSR